MKRIDIATHLMMPLMRDSTPVEEKVAKALAGADALLAVCRPKASPTRPSEPEGDFSGFAEFWRAYPRRVAKQGALKAWVKGGCSRFKDEILTDLKRRVNEFKNPAFCPHPATYLNQMRWTDEPIRQPNDKPVAGSGCHRPFAPATPIGAPTAEGIEAARKLAEKLGAG